MRKLALTPKLVSQVTRAHATRTYSCRNRLFLASFRFPGCGNPGKGTIPIPSRARHLGTDPVTKQRLGAEEYKPKAVPAPVEPGKLPPGRGRGGELSR